MTVTNKCTQDAIVIAGNNLLAPTFFIIIILFKYKHCMGEGGGGRLQSSHPLENYLCFP